MSKERPKTEPPNSGEPISPSDLGEAQHPLSEETVSSGEMHDDGRTQRSPAVCICPSCGRTEAQIPPARCHELYCPECQVPMRES